LSLTPAAFVMGSVNRTSYNKWSCRNWTLRKYRVELPIHYILYKCWSLF